LKKKNGIDEDSMTWFPAACETLLPQHRPARLIGSGI
jgi:hypothetical protein